MEKCEIDVYTINWLVQAGSLCKIYNSNKPNLPLSAYDDINSFKIYCLDIGILANLSNLELEDLYLSDSLLTEFKGAYIENFIYQSLIPVFEAKPRYWSSSGIAEIDFIIQFNNQIIPIEGKSKINRKNKSLKIYDQSYHPKVKVVCTLQNISVQGNQIIVPLFLIEKLDTILMNSGLLVLIICLN